MTAKQIALDVAAFLDSAPARALERPDAAEVRRIVESLIRACHEDLGKQPKDLDGQDVEALLTTVLPGRFARRDRTVEHAPAVVEAYFEHLETSAVVTHSFEIRNALAKYGERLREIVQAGENVPRAVRRDPVVHRAEKLGRNDPCSCGSGRKYKKCHGKGK